MTELKALCRILRRNRASSLVAIAMMGTAIAVAATTFALADAALLRQLPFRDSEELQVLVTTHPGGEENVSLPDFLAAREASLGDIAAANAFVPQMTLTGKGDPRQLRARQTTADYFRTLGVPLVQGRDFTRAEETPGVGTVAIVTNRLWREVLDGRPNVVGESLMLNDRSHTLVGVLPAYRDFLGDVDLYVPHQLAPTIPRRLRLFLPIVRVPSERAAAFPQALRSATYAPDDPDAKDHVISAVPLGERVSARPRSRVTLLFAAGLGLLAIATLNFTMLIAARARQRQAEFLVRAAIGATDGMIVRLVVLEAGALCLGAGLCALLLSYWMLPVLATRYGADIVNDVALDHRPLLFALASIGTALAFAVAATFGSGRRRAAGSRAVTVSRLVAGRGLVVAQLAISLALAVGSALLVRSFIEQEKVDPGFRVSERFTSRISLPLNAYPDGASQTRFWNALLTGLWAFDVDAAITSELPLTGQDNPLAFLVELATGERVNPKLRVISDRYFELMNIAVRDGRGIAATDDADAPLIVLINERFARLLPPGPALEQTISFDFGGGRRPAKVVGVVSDIRHSALNVPPGPEAYFGFRQTPLNAFSMVIASDRDLGAVSNALRTELRAIDAGRAFEPVQSYATVIERSLDGAKRQAQALTLFAAMATIVAASGLYSLLTFLVTGARREWSIRLAIGATAQQLQRMVIQQSLTYAIVGSVLGVAILALAASPLASSLYGVTLWDPLVAGSIALVFGVVTLAAAVLPARQVARISAAEVLQTSEPE
jgi:putative ABC transport system permease protein